MLALSLSSSFKFSWRAPKDIIFKSECVMHVHLLKVIKVVDFGTNQKGVCEFQQLWSYLTPFLRHGDLLAENCEFCLPHPCLTPPVQGTPMNICINLILPETTETGLHYCHWYYGSIFIQVFLWWAPKDPLSATEYVTAIQGHWNIGTDRKHVYDFLFLLVISSNLGPILHCFWDTATYWLKTANFSYPTLI